jgi:hypothetical protein
MMKIGLHVSKNVAQMTTLVQSAIYGTIAAEKAQIFK